MKAPEHPTTELLHVAHPIEAATITNIREQRRAFSSVLKDETEGFIDINGSCGVTNEEVDTALLEAQELQALDTPTDGILLRGYRSCVYKPRTNPGDWHGMETTHPEEAYKLIRELALGNTAVAMEVAYPYHIERYGKLLSFAWIGSRNVDKPELIDELAMMDITLPLGIKNGLDGTIDTALEHVERVNAMRQAYAQKLGVIAAPAVLIYRGGESADTPEAWEDMYIRAHEATGGLLVVDTAHGTEMAHHPEGIFKKSVEGQESALDHVLALTEKGYAPVAKLSEASNITGQTDPNMQLETSVEIGEEIHRLHTSRRTSDDEAMALA